MFLKYAMLHFQLHSFWLLKNLELFNCRKILFLQGKLTINLKPYQCLKLNISDNGGPQTINFLRILLIQIRLL